MGWIRLGACTGGSPCTHANTGTSNYGVNRTGNQLSGYAWGENIGWIHFKGGSGPTAYGVRLAAVRPLSQCRRCRSEGC